MRLKLFTGITQRDSNYYEFLQPAEALLDVKEKIEDLFDDEINEKFSLSSCQSCVSLASTSLTLTR